MPRSELAMSASLLTSSPWYSPSSQSGGSSAMPSWKWLVTSSEAGSRVYQQGAQ
jgi:hypothetical protein